MTPLSSQLPLPTHIRPIARSGRFSLLNNSQISRVSSVSIQPFLTSPHLLDQPDSLLQALEIQPILQASPVNLCKGDGINPSLQLQGLSTHPRSGLSPPWDSKTFMVSSPPSLCGMSLLDPWAPVSTILYEHFFSLPLACNGTPWKSSVSGYSNIDGTGSFFVTTTHLIVHT